MLRVRRCTNHQLIRVDVEVAGYLAQRQVRVVTGAYPEDDARLGVDRQPARELELGARVGPDTGHCRHMYNTYLSIQPQKI